MEIGILAAFIFDECRKSFKLVMFLPSRVTGTEPLPSITVIRNGGGIGHAAMIWRLKDG